MSTYVSDNLLKTTYGSSHLVFQTILGLARHLSHESQLLMALVD